MSVTWEAIRAFLFNPFAQPLWLKYLMQGSGSFLAVFAFTIMLGAGGKILIFNSIVAFLSWDTYAILLDLGWSNFAATFMGTLVVAIAAQIGARRYRTPVTMVIIPSLYPLVPGAPIYRCVNAIFYERMDQAGAFAIQAFIMAASIAMAVFLVESAVMLLKQRKMDTNNEPPAAPTQSVH
ncbi:threonine/serine exporter family protein [Levyella massiliensis]|uniref:threonine/serine exporter family protein n=1 Tax=Levyella massiliensis TaxID=938289 RepID=UPI0023EFE8FE|nr:threonine/serine exporter family protein [Levyella massiliensis]